MADLSDVLNTVYNQVVSAVYPDGTSAASVCGVDVTIVKGWPIRNKLDDQMKAGRAMVSIFPTNKERVITKFERVFQTVSTVPATLTAVVASNKVTIGGTVSVPQAVVITVDGIGYGYQVLNVDTLASIAAALAALLPNAVAVGPVITVADFIYLNAGIATSGTASEELGRQEREFMISCWCPSPDIRDLLTPPIDNYFRINYLPVFSDGFVGMIFYSGSPQTDMLEMVNIYRRDLFFTVQYATTNTQQFTTIVKPVANITVQQTPL